MASFLSAEGFRSAIGALTRGRRREKAKEAEPQGPGRVHWTAKSKGEFDSLVADAFICVQAEIGDEPYVQGAACKQYHISLLDPLGAEIASRFISRDTIEWDRKYEGRERPAFVPRKLD